MSTRLVFLIRDLGAGGAQRQLAALATGLARREGYSVTVVHFYPGVFQAELEQAGVAAVCVGKRSRWDLAGFWFRLVRVVRAVNPTAVHGYLNEGNLMALLLKPWCGWPRVIWGVRDSQTDAAQWGVLGRLSFRLNVWLSRFADLIIVNSRAGRDYYLKQGYPAERMEVAPNGIDVERFKPGAVSALRGEWSGAGGFVFGIIGRLNPMKDHETFLRAASLAAGELPEARFAVIGDGDEGCRRSLQALAGQLGISAKVVWQKAQPDMPAVYAALDAVVSTSAFGEGFSNVLGEAMACGLPCIATDVGDSAWLVDDADRVCPAGDAAAVARRMVAVAKMEPAERAALAERARLRIKQNFTVEEMVRRTAELLGGLNRPRRVTFITTGLGTGGAEMMLWQMLTRLDSRRFSPSVISLTAGGKYRPLLEEAGVPVESLDLPPGRVTLAAVGKLFRLMRRWRPEILAGWMYHGCYAATFARLFLPHRVRLLWSIRQSLYSVDLEKRGSARVIRALAELSWAPAAILYNSRVSAQQHEALGYLPWKRRLVVNGFDLRRWQPRAAAETRPESLRGLNGARLVGRFGRYAEMKDFPVFLEAAGLIAKEAPQAHFVLAGTQVDVANRALTEQAARLGLTDRVHLLGERDDLPELTRALDVAVSSSAYGEGFPNVVAEAMASGVPVVATDIGDSRQVVGEAGRIVPPRDAGALAAACLEVLRLQEEERRALGGQGRRRIEEHFSLQAAVRQLEDLLD